MSSKTRSYTELARINNFEERYNYLRVNSQIGIATFGFDRWLNQAFYTSAQWRHVRPEVIARDNGCDLGLKDHEIWDRVVIHHMNPIGLLELENADPTVFDPEYLITVSLATHNAIHYGDASLLAKPLVERRPGDTRLWKPLHMRDRR